MDGGTLHRPFPRHPCRPTPRHHAEPGEQAADSYTSGLLVQMFQHARLVDSLNVLDVGTGSGYGTALPATRSGEEHVTSVDVDPHRALRGLMSHQQK
ncbi:hypothetical protein GCM10010191_67340 [Actinomadura vinacea]|uniref:Protein-L-isoaspartate O-methyltransferase n=1 Tax=Actinomadura vinacea TaxID=115336 RepID=A0ABN3JVN4_9ACTN